MIIIKILKKLWINLKNFSWNNRFNLEEMPTYNSFIDKHCTCNQYFNK